MRTITIALLLAATPALADAPIAKSVPYFVAHPAEMRLTLRICEGNAQYSDTPTCSNAEAAASRLRAQQGTDINAMLMSPTYWSANPIAREGLLAQCRIGTAVYAQYCRPAAQSAMSDMRAGR